MKAVSKFLVGAAAAAALTAGAAAPAAAQYYPGGGYGGGGIGDVIVGQVLNNILRGGNPYGYNQYYGVNNYDLERTAVNQCARAAEQRLNARYGGYQNGYGTYGQNNFGQYRVVNVDRVERTRNGNMRVQGLAANTAYQGNYGYGYNQPYGGYNQPYGGYNQPYGGYNQPYGGYNNAAAAQFRFNCKFERSGRITDLRVSRNRY
jgi:hypothetical protein